MKESLRKLARGIFNYEELKLQVEDNLNGVSIPADSVTEGSIRYSASDNVCGVVWSNNPRVAIRNNVFSGREGRIEYQVDSVGLSGAESIGGTFDIVSNAGEYQVAFEFVCVLRSCDSSLGEIANLYDFVRLLKESDAEAKRLFFSEDFEEIILGGDANLKNMYRLLTQAPVVDENRCIEEFLVAAKCKGGVEFALSNDRCYYTVESMDEDTSYSVGLSVNTWGYKELKVSCDADFIRLSKSSIASLDFFARNYEYGYEVDKDKLRVGMNYARITFEGFNQVLTYEIVIRRMDNEISDNTGLIHSYMRDITQCYLDYRMKRIDSAAWIERSNKLIIGLRGVDDVNPVYKLFQAQIMIAMGQVGECEWLIESARADIDNTDYSRYCFYLYVNSLYLRDEDYTRKACGIIRSIYEKGQDDWRILWILFYMDKDYNHNQSIKLSRIKDAYLNGNHSPVLYYEAINVFNNQPMLLRVLNRFELQVMWFGCRNALLSDKLTEQLVYLIGAERVPSKRMLMLLDGIYKVREDDLTLEVLVSGLIRNGLYGLRYFELYEKAILRGLKITRLFEYYIKSMDKNGYKRLPKIVTMFFVYDSELSVDDKAYLYANIITNEAENKELIDMYQGHIQQFGYEQLKQRRISDDLIAVYRYIWNEHLIHEDTAEYMLSLLFTYRVRVYNNNIYKVVVKHRELKDITVAECRDGVAYVPMYTEGCCVMFIDRDGYVYKDSITYEIEKVADKNSLIAVLGKLVTDNVLYNIYRFQNGKLLGESADEILDNVYWLLESQQLDKDMRASLNSWLIDYYHEFYEGDDFTSCMNRIDISCLSRQRAVKLIEVCIKNNMYKECEALIDRYSYDSVSAGLVFKYLRYQLEKLSDTESNELVEMSRFVFLDKKYNPEVLAFMVKSFNGSNEQMYNLWKSCESFGVEAMELEERLLSQMLFTGEHNGRMTEVFADYYEKGGKRLVIDAYIAYHSFLYFIRNRKTNDIVFRVIYNRLHKNIEVQDICKLALLKNYSTMLSALSEEQLDMAKALINGLCKENKCFEFFKKFSSVMALPYNILDQTIIEYIGNPQAKVMIHYKEGNNGPMGSELMTLCGGVFVKSFTCFYGDNLSYYFTEEYAGEVKKSQIYNQLNSCINTDGNEGRFDYINDMLASRELHDLTTMNKLMHGYIVQDYVARQYFKPM